MLRRRTDAPVELPTRLEPYPGLAFAARLSTPIRLRLSYRAKATAYIYRTRSFRSDQQDPTSTASVDDVILRLRSRSIGQCRRCNAAKINHPSLRRNSHE